MKIGIIGAGHIGGTLTRRLQALGHDVRVANSRGPESLQALASETGATAVEVKDAPKDAGLVIVTIPEKNVPQLSKDLFANAPADLIVIDTGNYYPKQRDGKIAEIEAGLPESRWVEKQLGRSVIKSFNNIYAKHLLERGQPPAHQTVSLCLSQAMIRRQSAPSWTSSMNSASIRSTPEGLTSRGGSSRERRFTPPTAMPKGCAKPLPPPAASGRQTGKLEIGCIASRHGGGAYEPDSIRAMPASENPKW